MKTKVSILGSTGSIGSQSLDVIRRNPGQFEVVALAAGNNVTLLAEQIQEFSPRFVAVADSNGAEKLQGVVGRMTKLDCGEQALRQAATWDEAQVIVAGVSGFRGLRPVLAALEAGKHIALANKECLAAAGPLIRKAQRKSLGMLVPVDSEHSSVFQCLSRCGRKENIRRVAITASGGPFLRHTLAELSAVRPEEAVKHPRWKMGAKISVDSATLMNKGLEVIEAAVLFGLQPEQIEVLIHPESIVHGLVEFEDAMVLAAMSEPDMRVPISFALSYLSGQNPKQHPGEGIVQSGASWLELAEKGKLCFERPDEKRFPAVKLCFDVLRNGGQSGAVLNAANEVAVEAFLRNELGFLDILRVVSEVVTEVAVQPIETLDDVVRLDALGREVASKKLKPLPSSR